MVACADGKMSVLGVLIFGCLIRGYANFEMQRGKGWKNVLQFVLDKRRGISQGTSDYRGSCMLASSDRPAVKSPRMAVVCWVAGRLRNYLGRPRARTARE
jgi:hypothetical protein